MKKMTLTSALLIAFALSSIWAVGSDLAASKDHDATEGNAGPVADRLAIRELIESYMAAVIEQDAEKWIANWAEDGVWNLGGGDISGKDRILETWLTIMSPYEHTAMFGHPVFIQAKGDEGQAHWHTNERLRLFSGDEMRAVGRYKDRYIRVNGTWKIKRRDYSVVFTSASGAESME